MYTTYEVIKWWLPILSAFGIVIGAWRSARKLVTEWVERLLNNHLHHIELNTADAASALREQREEFVTLRKEQTQGFEMVRQDFSRHSEMDARIQQAILTNLEILKDRGC